MSSPIIRIRGTHLNVATTEETTLVLGKANTTYLLVSFHYVRTAGTGANYVPRLGQVAGWTNDDINERMTYASAGVGVPTNDVQEVRIPCITDASGQLYFRPGYDAHGGGAGDNAGEYEFYFEIAGRR